MIFKNFVSEDNRRSTIIEPVAAPLFRKSFELSGTVILASVKICGLGFYDLFINGVKITKGYLAPYISNPDDVIYYDIYDIMPYVKVGENVIGVMLGDGFCNAKTSGARHWLNPFNAAPKLAVDVEIETKENKLSFDAIDFKCKKGPLIFNDLRAGIHYDARLEDGWNSCAYREDESWHTPIKVDAPKGVLRLCNVEPIVVTREILPVSITQGELKPYTGHENSNIVLKGKAAAEEPVPLKGGYLYDFGENNAGIYRLKIKGKRGQKINIQCGEMLTDGKLDYNNINYFPDGYSQRDIYILKGDGEEIFEPMFTYHGFRYIYIEGITKEQATKELLTYLVMSSDIKSRGNFECSDEVINKIYEMARRSDISNFYYFPTDCPQREKNGWTGDASASAEHLIMMLEAENSLKEWLFNIRLAQREDGELPGIVPTGGYGFDWGNGPAWDSVIFNLPYFIYKYTGDKEVIKENAEACIKYLKYVSEKRDERGIIEIGLGDWVPVGKYMSDYDAPLGFTDSVMVLDMCCKAEIMFDAIGDREKSSYAKKLSDEMLLAIRGEYIDFDTMTVKGDCQTSQAMGLFYDIFKKSEKEEAAKRLIEIIHCDNDFITSGFLGLRVIFHVLCDTGEAELAYKMITREEYPSYGHLVKIGETTLPEQFMPESCKEISKNHHFFGDVANLFMRTIGGINVIDSETVCINPVFLKNLNYAKAEINLVGGSVKTMWERNDNKIHLTVSYPESICLTIDEKVEKNIEIIKKVC